MSIEEKIKNTVEEPKFNKSELLSAKCFANRKDAIAVLVGPDEKITISETRDRLDKFMKGKVK